MKQECLHNRGDPKKQTEDLYRKHHRAIECFGNRRFSKHYCDDLVGRFWLRIQKLALDGRFDELAQEGRFGSVRKQRWYLFRVLRLVTLELLRDMARQVHSIDDTSLFEMAACSPRASSLVEVVFQRELINAMRKFVKTTMSPKYYTVFVYCFLLGRSYEWIANDLGISEQTARVYVHEIRQAIRERFSEYDYT